MPDCRDAVLWVIFSISLPANLTCWADAKSSILVSSVLSPRPVHLHRSSKISVYDIRGAAKCQSIKTQCIANTVLSDCGPNCLRSLTSSSCLVLCWSITFGSPDPGRLSIFIFLLFLNNCTNVWQGQMLNKYKAPWKSVLIRIGVVQEMATENK